MNIWYGSNENGILSNLAERRFKYDDKQYISVEHAYQTLKSGRFDVFTYNKYKKPGIKIIGRWKADKSTNIGLMRRLMEESFVQNTFAMNELLNTGSEVLTHNQDTGIWRIEFPRILMDIREEYKWILGKKGE